MKTEKISVIVPCYNLEKHLKKTVNSILAQTYNNIEIILVDDGSSDETPEIIDELSNTWSCIRAYHKKNGGVTSARLYGLEKSSGEWVAFVDGDDLLDPEMYEVLYKNAINYHADVSHCGYEMVFPDHVVEYYGTEKLVEQSNKTGLKDLLEGKYIEPSLCNKLYKRELFKDIVANHLISLKLKDSEDLLMNYYLFLVSEKAVYYDKCFYHYVLRPGSACMSNLNKSKLLDSLYVYTLLDAATLGNPSLNCVAKQRKVSQLIDIATMDATEYWMIKYKRKAVRMIRKYLIEYLKEPIAVRIKIRVLLAAVWPELYSAVHLLYSKIRGTHQKYNLE